LAILRTLGNSSERQFFGFCAIRRIGWWIACYVAALLDNTSDSGQLSSDAGQLLLACCAAHCFGFFQFWVVLLILGTTVAQPRFNLRDVICSLFVLKFMNCCFLAYFRRWLLECSSCWLSSQLLFFFIFIFTIALLIFLLLVIFFIAIALSCLLPAGHLCHEFCSCLLLLSVEGNTVLGPVVM